MELDTNTRMAEHLGFATEGDFDDWLGGSLDEIEIDQLKAHRFSHYAGIFPLDHPCHCECGSGDHKKCEHSWDGPEHEDSFGGVGVTCSNCYTPFISHLLRTGP